MYSEQVCLQIGKKLIEIEVDFSMPDGKIEMHRLTDVASGEALWSYGESCGLIDILRDEIVSQIKEVSDER